VALRLEYNGTKFHGWERKPGLRTVQGTVEDALADITNMPIRTVAASKTDAGTHAAGQVVHFDSPRSLSGSR
jgi:tRNA pseudouridine38-40 synthase